MIEDVSAFSGQYTYGTWRKQRGFKPLHVVDAEGCFFTDASGKTYLDFNSQLMCSNLGHKNRAIIDAIKAQAEDVTYVSPGFTTTARAELAEILLEVLPPGLNKFFFTTSGTEANEAAIKIARAFTGKHKIIARYSSYHGSTAGSIALTGDPRRWFAEPTGTLQGVIHGPDVNCYRCPFGLTLDSCATQCVEYYDYMLEREGNVAAIIIEPIVGTNGILVPPDTYLPRLREITRKHGVLLIADEVMSGWGRTGDWFAMNHWGVVPDILCTAKRITGAYVPLGLAATSAEITSFFDDNVLAHGHTYLAHPMTLAPAIAAIKEMKRLEINERVRGLEPYVREKLEVLKEKHPAVGDVRGKGLFWAVEIVKNRDTREPFSRVKDKFEGNPMIVNDIMARMMQDGVYMMGWISHLILAPPLIITKEEIDQGIAALDKALVIADEQVT